MAQKPLILAVETSSRTGSVAIALGEKMLAEATLSASLRHSAEISCVIKDVLGRFARKPCEIQHIYISVGPGSLTGVRIATTLAKAFHLANAAKIVAVDTLDAIAANAADCEERPERIAAIFDAKRNQFFIAAYDRLPEETNTTRATSIQHQNMVGGIWKKVICDCMMSASEFVEKFADGNKPIWLLGDGLLYYKDKFKAEGIQFLDEMYWSPRASKVHLLGWNMALANKFADPVTLVPNYICRPDVKVKPR